MAEPATRAPAGLAPGRPGRGVVVAVVLGAAMATSLLPTSAQEVIFHTPLTIVVLDRRDGLAAVADRPARTRVHRDRDRSARRRGPDGEPRPLSAARRLGRSRRDVGRGDRRRRDRRQRRAAGRRLARAARRRSIEQEDIASGTSSRSSRLIHGGLRYLEQFRIGLVREALAERSRLLTLAPHLVPPRAAALPDLRPAVPVEGVLRRRADALRHPRRPARRRLASPADAGGQTLELAPTLRHDGLRGGLLYHDGGRGRRALHARPWHGPRWRRARVVAHPGPGDGRPHRTREPRGPGRAATDLLHGGDLEIPTRAVVDATGVWAAEADHPLGPGSLRILPSRGAHLVVPRRADPEQRPG